MACRLAKVAASAAAVLAASATAEKGGACSEEVAQLKRQLAEAQRSAASCGAAAQPISVMDAAAGVYDLGAESVGRLLEKTTMDEHIAGIVSDGVAKAKTAGAGVAEKVMAVDYASYVKDLQSHDLYQKHVEKHLRPVMDQYVSPALEKASAQVGPAFEAAKAASQKAYGSLSEQAPGHFEKVGGAVDGALDRLFDALAGIAPSRAGSLPAGRMDRVLFLLLGGFLAFHLLGLTAWALRLHLRFAGLALRVARWLVFFAVTLPFRLLGLVLRLGTCCYCCGLCGRKSKKAEAAIATNAKNKEDGPMATVEEITRLLENAKKEKKLEAGVKQLLNLAKSGKAMNGPKSMAGKKVSKESLTKAAAKFKELDAKKLGL
eukprot:TRINITY_DN64600_c0_g1_i1.p1 TRINITY_DN64600_c0_g1~~TRINITY_DN64600_c0_g1_i1.p1  ORF type:complete len:375 (+),score=121.79 TRINITY_DN64600_c0_g1_i1:72-1196(+)